MVGILEKHKNMNSIKQITKRRCQNKRADEEENWKLKDRTEKENWKLKDRPETDIILKRKKRKFEETLKINKRTNI